jgi:hypothetical protein
MVYFRLSFALFFAINLIAIRLSAGDPVRPLDEYEVKAAFLYNFAKFVEWPADVFEDPGKPLVICVLGKDPFGPALADVVAGKKIERRSVDVRRISDPARSKGCHILYVSASEDKHVLPVLAAMNQRGVLTVGESDSATSDGMIINFTLEDRRVRFVIDTNAAQREQVRVSSRLLSLAIIGNR